MKNNIVHLNLAMAKIFHSMHALIQPIHFLLEAPYKVINRVTNLRIRLLMTITTSVKPHMIIE